MKSLSTVRSLNLVASSPARGIGLEPIGLSTDAFATEGRSLTSSEIKDSRTHLRRRPGVIFWPLLAVEL